MKVHPFMKFEHRLFLLEEMPKNSVCAEIGIFEGTFSKKIMDICEPRLLHLIDPTPTEKFYWNEKRYFHGNYEFHKMRFEDTNFEDEYFDWVYLDADHKFITTFVQLELCYKKVKSGGLITGDDYNEKFKHSRVVYAVDVFLRKWKDKVELEYIKNWQYKIWKK